MSMALDAIEVSSGTGAACLGEPLRAGQVVLSGALGPMCAIGPLGHVAVTITGPGSVSATFPDVPEDHA